MPDRDEMDAGSGAQPGAESATALQLAADLLRVPIRLRVNIGGREFQVTRWSPIQQALEALPYAAVVLGVLLMLRTEPAGSVTSQLLYEASALIVVAGLLVAIVQRVARISVDPSRGEDSVRRFRAWARATLVVIGGGVICSAYVITSRRVADLLVTTGTAIVAAAGLDGLVVGPVERLYRFAMGGRHVLTFETDFAKNGRRNRDDGRHTLLRMWPLMLAIEPTRTGGTETSDLEAGDAGGDGDAEAPGQVGTGGS